MPASSALAGNKVLGAAELIGIYTLRIPIGATGAVGTLRQRGTAITCVRDSAGQYTFGNIPTGSELTVQPSLTTAADLVVNATAKSAANGTATVVCRTGATATDPANGNELTVTFIVESLP